MSSSIKRIEPLIFACFAWLASYGVSEPFDEAGWQYYALLALTDLVLLFIVAELYISNLHKRYMSVILTACVTVSIIASPSMAAYLLYNNSYLNSWALFINNYYTDFSLVMSLLLVGISITPKGLLNAIDTRIWPSSFAGIYCISDQDSMAETKKGLWSSRRARN